MSGSTQGSQSGSQSGLQVTICMHNSHCLTDDLPVRAAQCRPDLHKAGQVAVGIRQRGDLLTRIPLTLQVADEGGLTEVTAFRRGTA